MIRIGIFNCIIFLCFNQATYADEFNVEQALLLQTFTPASTVQHKVRTRDIDASLIPIRLLLDVRSNHSDGAHDFQTLITLAKQRHIDALVFTEHDRFTIRLGLEPIPLWVGYSQEHPSLYLSGLKTFFHDLQRAQNESNITLMAGTESTPGYDWQGIPFQDLSLHGAEKHIITMGVTKPEQIQALTSYQLTHTHGLKGLSLVFWFALVFILLWVLMRKRKRGVALLLFGSFIAFLSTWLIRPITDADHAFMQSAHEQNLLTIWAHPGTKSGVRDGPMGVKLNTRPYNKSIFDKPADAFAAVYGDSDYNTVAGGLWDRFMMDYMHGYIAKPMWAVAAGDYHEEGQANEYLGNFPMDVWAKSASQLDILDALKHGRMTAWHLNQHQNIAVSNLYLEYLEPQTKQPKRVLVGAETAITSPIRLVIGLHELGEASGISKLSGHWIIDGKKQDTIQLNINDTQASVSSLSLPQGPHVIRFQILPQQGIRLETNPFLVNVYE